MGNLLVNWVECLKVNEPILVKVLLYLLMMKFSHIDDKMEQKELQEE